MDFESVRTHQDFDVYNFGNKELMLDKPTYLFLLNYICQNYLCMKHIVILYNLSSFKKYTNPLHGL